MKSWRILIADDEPNIRLMLRTVLESDGYVVEEAANGRDALQAIKRNLPDLMILDLSMPVLDGMAVLDALRLAPPEKRPRIIVLTAYGSISAAVKSTRLGAMDFLEKPVAPDELRKSIQDVLAEPIAPAVTAPDPLEGGYSAVLDRVRKALRLANYADAEALLMRCADLSGQSDPAYFNLLGVLFEAQQKWRLAKKLYGKAIAADGKYQPAQQNMRRIYELYTFGKSRETVCLGDEADVLFFRIPDSAR